MGCVLHDPQWLLQGVPQCGDWRRGMFRTDPRRLVLGASPEAERWGEEGLKMSGSH